jgi:gas vesicle protein
MYQRYDSSFILGLCAGAAIGAGVALLVAPRTGADTREELRRLGRSAKGRVNDITERGRRAAAGVARQGGRVAERVASHVDAVAASPTFSSDTASHG